MKGACCLAIAVVFCVVLSTKLCGAVPPLLNQTIPWPCGVNIHFTTSPIGEVQMLANAGFKRVRMDFFWAGIERTKGVYNFNDYEILVNTLRPYDITPLFILDYGNPLYDDGKAPYTDEGRAAFAKFVVAGVEKFQGKGILWEMWNEPDLPYSWSPAPNADNYALLAVAVGKAIKLTNPNEIYIGPALSSFNWDFLTTVFKSGALGYFDYVSIHGYQDDTPEDWIGHHKSLTELIDQYKPRNKNIPIINSEWGKSDINPGFNKNIQATWLVRQYLATLSTGTPATIWYDWHDDGTNPNNAEDHFGTVYYPYIAPNNPYAPKPAYFAAQTFLTLFTGFTFSNANITNTDYVWTFNRGSEIAYAVWTGTSPHAIKFAIKSNNPGQCFKTTDYLGAHYANICAESNVLTVDASGNPLYLMSTN